MFLFLLAFSSFIAQRMDGTAGRHCLVIFLSRLCLPQRCRKVSLKCILRQGNDWSARFEPKRKADFHRLQAECPVGCTMVSRAPSPVALEGVAVVSADGALLSVGGLGLAGHR